MKALGTNVILYANQNLIDSISGQSLLLDSNDFNYNRLQVIGVSDKEDELKVGDEVSVMAMALQPNTILSYNGFKFAVVEKKFVRALTSSVTAPELIITDSMAIKVTKDYIAIQYLDSLDVIDHDHVDEYDLSETVLFNRMDTEKSPSIDLLQNSWVCRTDSSDMDFDLPPFLGEQVFPIVQRKYEYILALEAANKA